jgi:hypothetical protein
MKKSREIRPSEAVDLLTPFMPLKKNHCSLWKFHKETDSLIEKIQLTGEPLRLTRQFEVVAIVSDPKTYDEIEKRRSRLVALIDNIESKKVFIPRTRRISELDGKANPHAFSTMLRSLIAQSEGLTDDINDLKCRLYDREEKMIETEQRLRDLTSI